jgi:hypothetical protein
MKNPPAGSVVRQSRTIEAMRIEAQHLSAGLLAVVRYADWLSRLYWAERVEEV